MDDRRSDIDPDPLNPLARTCLCQDISSKDQEFSHKKPRRSTREQNRTPRAQGLSTSRVLVLSIFLPPRSPFALTFSGILRARFPGVTAPPPREPRQVPRKSRPPAPPPHAYPQPCRGPKTSWIALFCPLNTGGLNGANDSTPDQRDARRGAGGQETLIPAHRMAPSASRHCNVMHTGHHARSSEVPFS